MLQQLDTLIGFAVVMSVVSLLITIITQMISSLLGLRGSNLADGLGVMLHKIAPNVGWTTRRELIEAILTRPMISDSTMSMSEKFWDKVPLLAWLRKRWKRASAIRPEELIEVLKDIAEVQPDQARVTLAGLQSSPNQPPSMKVAALQVLSALHVNTPATAAKVAALNTQLPSLTQADQANTVATITQLNDATNIALENLEKLFNSAQDRAKQWFAMHTRLWTVLASVLMAFLLQLDTFRLIAKLSSDPNTRGKLVQFSQATLQKKADEVFTNTLSSPTIFRQALEQLKVPVNARTPSVPADIAFDSQAAAENWIRDQAGTNQVNATNLLVAFRAAVPVVVKENYERAGLEFSTLTDAFDKTGVELMQNPYPLIFTKDTKLWSWPWEWRLGGEWSWPASHLFGILCSAALLSLGAPFWFNSLKTLSNLRPMLASQIDQEQQTKSGQKTNLP